MKYIKAREVLITPNLPEMRAEENGIIATYIPVKKYLDENNQEYWKVTELGDSTWYSYENGSWATAVKEDEVNIVNGIVQNPTDNIYVWIPNYAYKRIDANNYDVKFLYGLTTKIVTSSNMLQDIPAGYVAIIASEKRGKWYNKTTQSIVEQYSYLNKSIYKLVI